MIVYVSVRFAFGENVGSVFASTWMFEGLCRSDGGYAVFACGFGCELFHIFILKKVAHLNYTVIKIKKGCTIMKKIFVLLMAAMMLTLSACASTNNSTQSDDSSDDAEIQYDYQLKAGETAEVYDVTFEEMVTVTVDPASTRDASTEMRSNIYFGNCVFNGGLTIVGDYHAMVSLGEGCSFGEGSVVTCKEATPGVAKETTMDDNYVKIFVDCEGVIVDTESAFGVVTGRYDFVFNGTTYSKEEIAPDAGFLGVYSVYEGDTMTYVKLALGEDDSVEYLD